MRRTWIKLWVDQCLRGSMISELTPEQRWIFVGLILMAGDSEVPGVVFRRKDENGDLIGYSSAVLADTLGVSEEAIPLALNRMVEKDKVKVDARGVISIVNWSKYQSDYERTKDAPSRRSTKVPPEEVQKYGPEGERDREEEGEEESSGLQPPLPSVQTPADIVMAQWNRFAEGHGLSPIKEIKPGSSRARTVAKRLKEKSFNFEDILRAIHQQPFLTGDNDRGWLITFDWSIAPKNMTKILELAYFKDVRGRAKDRQPEDPYVGGRK